jgi:hypothetical protein
MRVGAGRLHAGGENDIGTWSTLDGRIWRDGPNQLGAVR